MRINLLRLRKDVQMTAFVVQLIHDACIYNRSYRLASLTFQATLRKSRSVVFIISHMVDSHIAENHFISEPQDDLIDPSGQPKSGSRGQNHVKT